MKRFQFTIRDLLLIIVIAALAAGWWIDHQRINRLAVQQWEYKSVLWRWDDETLNGLGGQGWDAFSASVSSDAGGPNGMTVIFKRPK